MSDGATKKTTKRQKVAHNVMYMLSICMVCMCQDSKAEAVEDGAEVDAYVDDEDDDESDEEEDDEDLEAAVVINMHVVDVNQVRFLYVIGPRED